MLGVNRSARLGNTATIPTAEVERSRADAQAQLALATKSHARLEQLRKGARKEDRGVTTNRLLAAKGRLALALANLQHRHVTATAPATVLQSRFHAGEYFNVGGAPLFVLGDVSGLQVRTEVDEIDAFRVKVVNGASSTATTTRPWAAVRYTAWRPRWATGALASSHRLLARTCRYAKCSSRSQPRNPRVRLCRVGAFGVMWTTLGANDISRSKKRRRLEPLGASCHCKTFQYSAVHESQNDEEIKQLPPNKVKL